MKTKIFIMMLIGAIYLLLPELAFSQCSIGDPGRMCAGCKYTVGWSCSNCSGELNMVQVYMEAEGGTRWNLCGGLQPHQGSCEFTVPAPAGIKCRLCVKCADGPWEACTPYDTIGTLNVNINSPSTCVSYPGFFTIVWTTGSCDPPVEPQVEYKCDDGPWLAISCKGRSSEDSKTYCYWQVPNVISSNCYLRVWYQQPGGCNDIDQVGPFSIMPLDSVVISPNGGEYLFVDSTYWITWHNCFSGNVRISYSYLDYSQGIRRDSIIVESTPNNGEYPWIIPDTPSPSCYLRICNAEDPSVCDSSNSGFFICKGFGAKIAYRILSPGSWSQPPLKVAPSGSRTLIYRVYSIGCANLVFSVNSDNSCIAPTVPPTILAPGDSATLTATVSGSGTCDNSFISGNIIVSSNDPDNSSIAYPVLAVVSNDYYECPNDPVTNDTLNNGVFNFYVNANTQEWIHDIGTFSGEMHEVFKNGGPFVATTESNDTLVGRFYGDNDQHALAQVDLKQGSYTDFWLEYSWNVSIHDLNPPVDDKWWWFDILHEDVFFKSTASDDLKHTVIKFVTAERHNPPTWWPTHPTFTGYEDTYIGMMMDIDCPWDTLGDQTGRNRAGYDATNNIAWQRGWDYTGAHPSYNDYYAGLALAQGY
jgi:hypothetical protein